MSRLLPTREESEKCLDRLMVARTALVLRFPFFGILACKLIPVEQNTWCQTLAVDGRHLYYNVKFIMGVTDPEERKEKEELILKKLPDTSPEQMKQYLAGLTDKNLLAAICHEILHCAYNHFLRRGSRDPQLFNKAADYAINQILVRDKIGEIQSTWLYDTRFDGMNAEEIYNILQQEKQDDEDGQGQGQGGTFDQHGSPDDSESGQSRGKAGDVMSGAGGDSDQDGPNISKEDMEKYMDDFQSTMQNASGAGSTPAEIERMVNKLRNPRIDWRSKLHRTLRSCIKNDVTFMNPSRRSWSNMGMAGSAFGSPIFPGLKPEEEIDICVAIDTSGSIGEQMLRDFLSEVYGITKQFTQFKIKLLCFDTSVHNPKDYDPSNVSKLLEYDIRGGGGTLFECVWEHMKEEGYKPAQLVMFTDGMPCHTWGEEDYCKTLFVVHTYDVDAPFGDTVHYNYEEKE